MPSNKTPSVVSPGTGLPVASTAAASAIGDALKAHIDDPVGAHAGSAISYVAGPAWYDGGTNPDADVQVEIDKILSDLTAAAGGPVVDGAGKIGWYAGANWANGDTNPTTSVGLQLRKIITDLATFGSSPSGAHHIGAAAQADSFTNAPQTLLADEVYSQISSLLLYTNTPYRTVLLDAVTTTYTLTASPRVTQILVDSTTGTRDLVLPETPADHKGWTWCIRDIAGYGTSNNFVVKRFPASTYLVNGLSGPQWKQFKERTLWVIFCDGTDFSIHEVPDYIGRGASTAVSYALFPGGYTLDQWGTRDTLLLVGTTSAPASGVVINLPDPSLLLGNIGREVVLLDIAGYSESNPTTLVAPGGVAINGVVGPCALAKNRGQWRVISTTSSGWLVQEMAPPTMPMPVVTNLTTPFDLAAGTLQYEDVYVDTTASDIVVTLPTQLLLAKHKNQKWHIWDVSTPGINNKVTIARAAAATYKINGAAADLDVRASSVAHEFGHWVVICNGTDFFVHEVPPATGGLDWQNTWSQPNAFSHVSPIDFNYVGDQTITKSTAGFLEFYTQGEFRVRSGAVPAIVRFREFTRDWVNFTQTTSSLGSRYVHMYLGSEGVGTTTPFALQATPHQIATLSPSSDSTHGLEIMPKGTGTQGVYLRLWAGGGADAAGQPRGHLVLEMNSNEGKGENVTYVVTQSVVINPATTPGYYTLPTNVGGARSYGRKPPNDTVCIVESYVCSLGVDDSGGMPYSPKNSTRWVQKRIAQGYRDSAGNFSITGDAAVFTRDDSGLYGTVPDSKIIADANGFHVQARPGDDIASWRQVFWGYLKITTFTWPDNSWDLSV